MSSLDQLQPLIAPPAIGFWPPAPGWWLLLLVIPLLGWGLWWLRRFLPARRPVARAEQPLDPLRIAALAELALMPKPYDGARLAPGCSNSTACSSACAVTTTLIARATPSTGANGWPSWITAAPPPA